LSQGSYNHWNTGTLNLRSIVGLIMSHFNFVEVLVKWGEELLVFVAYIFFDKLFVDYIISKGRKFHI